MEFFVMDEDLNYTVPKDMSLFPVEYKKQKITHTMSADVLHDFDVFCKKNRLNKSLTIQVLIENFLENNMKKE